MDDVEEGRTIFNLFIPAVFTEQYIEGMGQSQNTAVLWPNGLRL
jgi:hypothetical protein